MFYLLCGGSESTEMVPDMLDMKNTLLTAGFDVNEIAYVVKPNGQHSEWFWRDEFSDAHQWLFADYISQTSTLLPQTTATFLPNPAHDTLNVSINNYNGLPAYFTLTNAVGKTVLEQKLNTANSLITLPALPKGIYIARLSQINKQQSNPKITVIDVQQIVVD